MRMTSASKNSWTTRKKPSLSGRMTSPPLQNVTASSTLQRQAGGKMQDEWSEKKADKIETYAATKNSKMFFSAIKEVYGPTKPRTTPLLSADGSTLLKEKSSINARWREHFSTLLNRPSTVDPTVLDQISQKPVITSLDLPPPPPPPTLPPTPASSPNDRRSMKFRKQSDRPARENPLGWTGFLQRSSRQPVQWPSKHSTHSSPASGKKRMCPKKSGMPHSSPCSRTGAVRLTAATTGASLSCPSLGRSWLGSSSTASSPTSRRKTCWKPSVDFQLQHHRHDLLCMARCRRSASNRIWTSLPSS